MPLDCCTNSYGNKSMGKFDCSRPSRHGLWSQWRKMHTHTFRNSNRWMNKSAHAQLGANNGSCLRCNCGHPIISSVVNVMSTGCTEVQNSLKNIIVSQSHFRHLFGLKYKYGIHFLIIRLRHYSFNGVKPFFISKVCEPKYEHVIIYLTIKLKWIHYH